MKGFSRKFRVYDKKYEKMLVNPQNLMVSGSGTLYTQSGPGGLRKVNAFRFELMWCIGHVDKDQKEIYEGDVVKRVSKTKDRDFETTDYGGALGVVVFEDGRFKVDQRKGHKWTFYGPDAVNFSWDRDVKVIGDVFQSNELLKDDE